MPPSTRGPCSTTWTGSPHRSPILARHTTHGCASAACPTEWITMTSTDTGAPRLPWHAADPYPFYARRRCGGEVVWDDTAKAWLALSYDAARQVLGGTGWSSDPLANPANRDSIDPISGDFTSRSMLFADG